MNNGDLISRKALTKRMTFYKSEFEPGEDFDSAVLMINNAPAVDAVEVVRCKDCVHCRMSYDPKRKISDQVCGFVGYNPIQSSCVTDDFFCSYGERRNE